MVDDFMLKLSVVLVPGLFAVTGHEVAHGAAAYRFGDSTAKDQGRLTLNPLRHIDPIGLLMLFLIGIGWARPVPVDFSRLRSPRLHGVLTSLAGPAANLILALLSALLLRVLDGAGAIDLFPSLSTPLTLMLCFGVYVNLLLAIFNMIPLPPLDGGKVAAGILPPPLSRWYASLERFGLLLVVLLFVVAPSFPGRIVSPPLHAGMDLLLGQEMIARIAQMPVTKRLGIFPF